MSARPPEAARIEAEYPGWRVERYGLGDWYATPAEPVLGLHGLEYRPNLGAGDPPGLRAALAAWGARGAPG